MEERKQQYYIKELDMDDLKNRLSRIEQQGVDAHVSNKIIETSYADHKIQNEKDFKHVDDCLHRTENESKGRDEGISANIKEMRADIQELKKYMYLASGALTFITPAINYFLQKFI